MFRKQSHGILIACERAQSQTVRRTFSHVYILFIILGFFPPLVYVTGLTLALGSSSQLEGIPGVEEVSLFLTPGRDRTLLCLPCIPQLSGSCWNWHDLRWQARGGDSPGFWHCPQGELFLTAGIAETALKKWQNQPLAFFVG